VLGAEERVVEETGFLLSLDQDVAGTVGEALEDGAHPPITDRVLPGGVIGSPGATDGRVCRGLSWTYELPPGRQCPATRTFHGRCATAGVQKQGE
jgi:hypothetical protein